MNLLLNQIKFVSVCHNPYERPADHQSPQSSQSRIQKFKEMPGPFHLICTNLQKLCSISYQGFLKCVTVSMSWRKSCIAVWLNSLEALRLITTSLFVITHTLMFIPIKFLLHICKLVWMFGSECRVCRRTAPL